MSDMDHRFSVNNFRRFRIQETKGQDPSSSQVTKSRYTKPRCALWMSWFSVNKFRRFSIRETRGQDPSSSQVTKSQYMKPRRAIKTECLSTPLISGGIVTVRSRSMRVVDLIHEFPYQNLGIGVTRYLDSLHHELPVHETPERSGPLDPNH